MKQLLFDPAIDPKTGDPIPGSNRSVRAYFQAVSPGLADLDVVVLPAQTIAETDVPPTALEATMGAQLRSEGFVGAAIVMPAGACGETTVNTSFNWTRICMGDDLGGWVGELLHNQCNLPDLFDYAGDYPSGDNMGAFDQEAGYDATHPSAWTKRAVGWLDPSAVALHPGGVAEYTLYPISLTQPPPTGKVTAVQIGAEVPYLMVEARLQADQFDINIPNAGVIVYRVQTTDPLGTAQNEIAPLALLTKKALTAGQSFRTDGVTIDVDGAVMGGASPFRSRPSRPANCCPMETPAFRTQRSSADGWTSNFSSRARIYPAKTESTLSTKPGSCSPTAMPELRGTFRLR